MSSKSKRGVFMMTVEELKHMIETNTYKGNILIAKCPYNSDFIFHQYLSKYIKDNNLNLKIIDTIDELPKPSLFNSQEDNQYLYYLITDTLKDVPTTQYKLWIKILKPSKKIKESDYYIEFKKIEDWQIIDYIHTVGKDLSENQERKLFKLYGKNLFRLEIELNKISIFDHPSKYFNDQLFDGKSIYSVFDLSNAIVQRDVDKIIKIYHEIDSIDIEPFGLYTILCDNFRKIIGIQLGRNVTPEQLGVSDKQLWVIKKYSCGHYSNEELVNIYKWLLDIDYKIKSGKFDTNFLLDYIVYKIIST